jgi:hypothetical protein
MDPFGTKGLREAVGAGTMGLVITLQALIGAVEKLTSQVETQLQGQLSTQARLASELRRIREILEPASQGSATSFRAGYEGPPTGAQDSWIGETDEVKGYLHEQLTKAFGRPLTEDEEQDYGIGPNPGPHPGTLPTGGGPSDPRGVGSSPDGRVAYLDGFSAEQEEAG